MTYSYELFNTALQMSCAQINVVNGAGTAHPATVSFPGAYTRKITKIPSS